MKLITTKSKYSPLTFHDRVCWSVMVCRKSTSQYRMKKITGFGSDTIQQCYKVLDGFDLIARRDGEWAACEPSEKCKQWFSWMEKPKGVELRARLRYTKVVE